MPRLLKILPALMVLLAIFTSPAVLAATSTNKGYDLQSTGANRGLWGTILNNNLTIVDKNVGGRVDVSVAGSSNVTVSAGNAQYLYHKLTGILTGNIQYVLPDAGGLYVIENATTGSFSITVDNVLAGTGVVVPQGKTMVLYDDADNNQVVSAITYISGVLLPANNLSDVSAAATAFANIKQTASDSATGVCELATNAETVTGTDTTRCTTPAGVAAAVSAAAPGSVPSGAVFSFAGSSAPSGYLLAYGQAINRTTYATLFTAIGTVYGTGDGSTTFNLPDCRGRVIAGKDDMGGSAASRLTTAYTGGVAGATLGASGGEQGHTQTLSELVPHNHEMGPFNAPGPYAFSSNQASTTISSQVTSTTGGGLPMNVVQPTIIMNCIIKT